MRVLRITPLWDWRAHPGISGLSDPSEGVGGHAAQAVRITTALADLDVCQTVLAPRAAGGPKRHDLMPGVTVTGVGPAAVPGVHRRNVAWLCGVLAALPAERSSHDVVHLHASGIVEPLWAAQAAARLVRAPLVLTLHHSAQLTYVPQSRRDAAVQVVTRAAERGAVRSATSTLALSRRVAGRLGGEAVPDCLDVASFRAAAKSEAVAGFRAELGIPGSAPLVVYVGRISAEKGWRDLADLVAQLGDVHVVACGGGPELADLEHHAGQRFHVLGPVSAGNAAVAMAAADVLVLPSRFEELGSVLLEAMAVGTPCVAYDVGGVAEAVVPGVTGILVRPSELVRGVREVLGDVELRERARTEGPTIAAERYDAAVIARRLLAIYERAKASTSRT